MHPNMIIKLAMICVYVALSSSAFATSGWDQYSKIICEEYKLEGGSVRMTLIRTDPNGNVVEPAVLSVNGCRNPEYFVTRTHVHIRCELIGDKAQNYYTIK